MGVKEFLKQYEEAEKVASRLKTEYSDEIKRLGAIKSPLDNDGMPHGTNISKPVEMQAIRLAKKAERYKEAELEALRIRQQVFDVINRVEGVKGQILFERYINLKKWEDVAETVHFSIRQTLNLHGIALSELKNCIELHFLK